ncbi:hypothetical protein D3C78_1603110 [compost metagenome]
MILKGVALASAACCSRRFASRSLSRAASGSTPDFESLRASAAFSRASLRLVSGYLPSPILRLLPSIL